MVQTFRQRIEHGFAGFGKLVARHPWIALFTALALVVGLASNVPKIVMDTATESFLHDEDPALLAYNAFRDQFGRDELVVIAIETPDVFAPEFLKKLETLHRELVAGVPHLDDVTSLINARNTYGKGDDLIVEDLFETWPDTPEGLAAKKARALANPLFRNLLLAEDGRITAVVIRTDVYSGEGMDADAIEGFEDLDVKPEAQDTRPYLTDAENTQMVKAVQTIAMAFDAPDFQVHVAGSPVVAHVLKASMQTNMKRFNGLAVLIISVILFSMFRRITGIFLPLLVVAATVAGTLGLLPLTGRAFTLPMQILPSFLLAVGVGASVHLMAIFFRHLQHGNPRRDSVSYALGHSGLPIVMTSFTTAAGLASFSGAE
ncbi:MAG: MMPL family transporter, partial [Alphaproteobacteria bacterium]|nr:MMPL family transporter [Alphaproteobacteria bacterium]